MQVTKIFTSDDRAEKVLPIVLGCLKDDSDEDQRILGLHLMNKLANYFGKDICQNFLMKEIQAISDDPNYMVRKETILNLTGVSNVVGQEIFEKHLLPVNQ